MRLIDADELMELYDGCDGLSVPIAVVRQNIEDAPTVDAEPVRHGHWVETEFPYGCKQYRCSNCIEDEWWNGKFAYGDEHYCPNCGAKMDEVSE